MKERVYTAAASERDDAFLRLRDSLEQAPDVAFAYVFGSFLDAERFHDVDVGVYLLPQSAQSAARIFDSLAARLDILRFPVDIRILNDAPVSFVFHVLHGRLLFSRDDELRADVTEDVLKRYFDIEPLLRHYAREAFAG